MKAVVLGCFQYVQMKLIFDDDKSLCDSNSSVTLSCGSTGAGLFRANSALRPRTEPWRWSSLHHSLRAIMEVMSCQLWRSRVPTGARFASN